MGIKYSVVIPLYNKEECIEATVRSVLAQTVSEFEIVIVDDGSTDHSVKIINSIQDSRIRIIAQRNQGVSAARNTGIKNASGQYVCFLDADDLWENNFLETVDELIHKFPTAKVFCPSYRVSYGKRIVNPKWRSVDPEKDSLVNDFYEMATGAFWVTHSSCTVVEKEALERLNLWFPVQEKVYEDFLFWIQLGSKVDVAHGNRICATYFRITQNNARKSHFQKLLYSKSYMDTLDELIVSPDTSVQQKNWLKQIRDRRMIPYVFSALCTRQRKRATDILKEWIPVSNYEKYKLCLKVMCLLPYPIIRMIQIARYYLF